MSFIKALPPQEILRAFTTGLGDFIDQSNPLWSLLEGKYVAQQVFNLDLHAIPQTEMAPSVLAPLIKSTGWRFLAADAGRFAACHVGSITPDLPPKLTGVSTELPVLQAIEGIGQLEALKEVATRKFEVRTLRIAWLRFEAFWLSAQDGGPDLVVPYMGFVEGPPNKLKLMKAYAVNEFLRAIWVRAQRLHAELLDARAQALAVEVQDHEAAAEAAGAQQRSARAAATAAREEMAAAKAAVKDLGLEKEYTRPALPRKRPAAKRAAAKKRR
jgi:hypothetical protein